MGELVPGLSYEHLVEATRGYRDEASFRRSPFFAEWGPALLDLLRTPRVEAHPAVSAPPDDSFRVVQWNIEKGKRLDLVRARLLEDPILRRATVFCLNEVDVGMARSGPNADVARELANALSCHHAFVPSYLELTKGVGDELEIPSENDRGFHGLAILSRIPITDARVVELPACFDYFGFHEKRLGTRQGLLVRLEGRDRTWVVGTTHLEVRNTPACRARQFAALLDGVEAAADSWGNDLPIVLTGDFNTHSFRRGKLWYSLIEFLRIVRTSEEDLDAQLARPFDREPLFRLLQERGFQIHPFNDRTATASTVLGSIEDLGLLPGFAAKYVSRRFGLGTRRIHMRLDWISGRGCRSTGSPRTLPAVSTGGHRGSDHEILVSDIEPGSLRFGSENRSG